MADDRIPDHPYVLLVYFTPEEHSILSTYFAASSSDYSMNVLDESVDWLEATRFPLLPGIKHYLIKGKPGPGDAQHLASAIAAKTRPELVVNIGTAGRLKDWLPLPTICMPKHLMSWDNNAAIEQVDDKITIKSAPYTHPQEVPEEISTKFDVMHPGEYNDWMHECTDLFHTLLGDRTEELAAHGVTLTIPTTVDISPFASGSMVVKSQEIKNQIRDTHRDLAGVEMESYQLTTTLNKNRPSIRTLVIRVLTDPATMEGKDLLDSFRSSYLGKEFPSVKLFGLTCAAALARRVIPYLLPHQTSNVDVEIAQVPDWISMAAQRVGDAAVVAAYAKYFSIAVDKVPNARHFDELLDSLQDKFETEFKATGLIGSGKSTYLACLYLCHRISLKAGRVRSIPHFIDLHRYLHGPNTGHLDLVNDLTQIVLARSDELPSVLYVDGYNTHRRDEAFADLHRDLVRFRESHNNIRVVYGVGWASDHYGLSYNDDEGVSPGGASIVFLQPMPVDAPELKPLVEAFSECIALSTISPGPLELLHRIEKLRSDEVDLFTLWIHASPQAKDAVDDPHATIGPVYHKFCVNTLTDLFGEIGSKRENQLKALAERVFLDQVPEEAGETSDRDASDSTIDRSMVLAHKHPTIMQFLIAEHIINSCMTGNTAESLGQRIYHYGINRFLKTSANRKDEVRQTLFRNIRNAIEDHGQNALTEAHLFYILGRLALSDNDEDVAKQLLRDHLDDANSKYNAMKQRPPRQTKQRDRRQADDDKWLPLLIRTLYISLIYLGDGDLAEEYVRRVLVEDEWDLLNRGFHLQYYGDAPSTLKRSNMAMPDRDLKRPPLRVHRQIVKNLGSGPTSGRDQVFKPISLIEIHTMLSLHVNRHLRGTLPDNLRIESLAVVRKWRERWEADIFDDYSGYLDLAFDILNHPTLSISDMQARIAKLKDQMRSGWNYAGPRNGGEVHRRVRRTMWSWATGTYEPIVDCYPESVAAHSWGCAMLAWSMLPPSPTYNIDRIIKMLLVHDIAEAEDGDRIKGTPTEAPKNHLDAKFASMGSLDHFRGISDWADLLEDMRTEHSLDARIAKDIDKIELYLQAVRYAAEKGNDLGELKLWLPKPATREGQNLLKQLTR